MKYHLTNIKIVEVIGLISFFAALLYLIFSGDSQETITKCLITDG